MWLIIPCTWPFNVTLLFLYILLLIARRKFATCCATITFFSLYRFHFRFQFQNPLKMESTSNSNNVGSKYANFRVLYLLVQLIGCTLLILMLCWVFIYLGGLSWSSTPSIQFNWHPLLMTLGMIYLYGNCKTHIQTCRISCFKKKKD